MREYNLSPPLPLSISALLLHRLQLDRPFFATFMMAHGPMDSCKSIHCCMKNLHNPVTVSYHVDGQLLLPESLIMVGTVVLAFHLSVLLQSCAEWRLVY